MRGVRTFFAVMAAKSEGSADTNEPLPAQIPPVPRSRSQDNRGGYDCEFVEPPPSGLQTECPVCLLVLKEPCIISCCGHKLCRECIERIVKGKKPCALCNKPDFTFLPERALERSLKDLEVWCSYRKEGCEWKGKLGKLEEHLNRDPSPENRLSECQFVAVECTHKCGVWFQRRHITTHETQQCKKRPYSCDYCRDYHSTFEDVTEVHYHQCCKYPVACPICNVQMERQNVESHLNEHCPLKLVDCPFSYAGCKTQLPRKDMPEHLRENITHLTLLATVMKEKQKVVEREDESRQNVATVQASLHTDINSLVVEMLKDLDEEKKASREKMQLHSQKVHEMKQDFEKQLHGTETKMNQELRKFVEQEMSTCTTNSSVEKMHRELSEETKALKKRIEIVQNEKKRLLTSCVVLLCIVVAGVAWFVGNQQLQSHVTHEMRQSIESLEDTLRDFQLKEEKLHASHDTELVNKHQLTENEVRGLKEGVQKQKLEIEREMRKTIESLEDKIRDFQLKEEKLHASHEIEKNNQTLRELVNEHRALKEEIQQQELEVQHLLSRSGFPVDYHIIQTDEEVYLEPAFYTHQHGYRMCVSVVANGYGNGKGTHVSIFTHMMQGPFDDYLKWPFRGEITIQIVNQVGDHGHVEMTIPYNDQTPDDIAGRVTGKERDDNNGLGTSQFLAHDKLQYNAERKTQYLKNDTLHIRVVKVELTEIKVRSLNEGIQQQELELQHLSSRSGFPVDYHVKRTDEAMFLEPAFYTHPNGYRMCVCVYLNGYGDGEGTHVSILTHLMRGPFDDYLKWPFRGEITIQIMNQVGEHDHIKVIIPYNDETPDIYTCRVTGKERADHGRGVYQFPAHDKLQYNAERKTQYLKDDTLHIRVVKVKLTEIILKKEIQKQELEVQHLLSRSGFPVDYHVKQTDVGVFLEPAFYTHPNGYRMCVRVYPNGYGDGEGTHVSIFTFMMQGLFDDYLKWPFRGEITIQIVNQVGDHDHVEGIIQITDNIASRVTGKERADEGWGKPQFLAHDKLQYNAERNTQYLKDNTLHIRVVKVELTEIKVRTLNEGIRKQELEVQHLLSRSGFPVDYHVKQTDEGVFLEPAFYTHPNGYRMCVRVYPNGYGERKGTHVSIFTFMMQGPFDDHLKWPFRGEITIQIVNQVGDHGHVEGIIDYNDQTSDTYGGRVTGKEIADEGWGVDFLAHDKLQYNAEWKTQYLKDNTLHIRVVKVVLS